MDAGRVDAFNELRGRWPRRKFEVRELPRRNTQFRWNHDLAVLGSPLPAAAKVTVLSASRFYGNRKGDDMLFRQQKLAELRGVSVKTVQRHLAMGRTAGFIDWEHRSARDPESGQVRQLANRYRLMIPALCTGPDGKVRRPDAPEEPPPPEGWKVTEGPERPPGLVHEDPAAEARRAWSELPEDERAHHLATARALWRAAKPAHRNVAALVACGVPIEAAMIVAGEASGKPQQRAGP